MLGFIIFDIAGDREEIAVGEICRVFGGGNEFWIDVREVHDHLHCRYFECRLGDGIMYGFLDSNGEGRLSEARFREEYA